MCPLTEQFQETILLNFDKSIISDLSPTEVEETLWGVFRIASIGGLDQTKGSISKERVSRIFDQLILLVERCHKGLIQTAGGNEHV